MFTNCKCLVSLDLSNYIDFGRTTDEVVVGDWDGDGYDTLCISRGITYYINNTLEGGNAAMLLFTADLKARQISRAVSLVNGVFFSVSMN